MSEYIINDEQIKEAVEFTPPYKTLSYAAKYKISGAVELQGVAVHGLPEIVRCRDCRYLCDGVSMWGCGWHYNCLTTNDGTPPDGFCAWGERNDSETIEVWKPSSPDDVTCYEGKE